MALLNLLQMVIVIRTCYNWCYSNPLARQQLSRKRNFFTERKSFIWGSQIIQTNDKILPKQRAQFLGYILNILTKRSQTLKNISWDSVKYIDDPGP